MIHPDWRGGGLPRFATNATAFLDAHFTASQHVKQHMHTWIARDHPTIHENQPVNDRHRITVCYIGTHRVALPAHTRARTRARLRVSDTHRLVLFAARFVDDKGIDTLISVINLVAAHTHLRHTLRIILVGAGDREPALREAVANTHNVAIIKPPASTPDEMAAYYAAADVFLLPSVNEGIALVLYEAMAAGLLVIATDVGGQSEVVTSRTGILVQPAADAQLVAARIMPHLEKAATDWDSFQSMRVAAAKSMATQFTSANFCQCVLAKLLRLAHMRANNSQQAYVNVGNTVPRKVEQDVVRALVEERQHGSWSMRNVDRDVGDILTIGVVVRVCNRASLIHVHRIVWNIRSAHAHVRVILANDGDVSIANEGFMQDDGNVSEMIVQKGSSLDMARYAIVKETETELLMLMQEHHVMMGMTDLHAVTKALRVDEFDIVGIRVRNVPGVTQLEQDAIVIPLSAGRLRRYKNGTLARCIWDENGGISVHGMQRAVGMQMVHGVFVGRTETLSNVGAEGGGVGGYEGDAGLFVRLFEKGAKVGYLPSVFVHRQRRENWCGALVEKGVRGAVAENGNGECVQAVEADIRRLVA